MPDPLMAFTIRANGLLRVLKTQIEVSTINLPNVTMIEAIWDTGATGSTITTKVVQALGLVPIGMTQVNTANGIATQNTYLVNIKLPNGLGIRDVTVMECAALSSGCDALIGMDIINLGDLSITNHQGKTVMS